MTSDRSSLPRKNQQSTFQAAHVLRFAMFGAALILLWIKKSMIGMSLVMCHITVQCTEHDNDAHVNYQSWPSVYSFQFLKTYKYTWLCIMK